MPQIRVQATRWVSDEPQPGIVECVLVDASGARHLLHDKCAIFDAADVLRRDAAYPTDLLIPCRIVARSGSTLTVELAGSIESTSGTTSFRVPLDSVVDHHG